MEVEQGMGGIDRPDWLDRIAAITAGVAAERSASFIEKSIAELLQVVREELGLEVVFLGEFVADKRFFRHIVAENGRAPIEVGQSHFLDQTICARIVDGSMPKVLASVERVRAQYGLPFVPPACGAHVGVPVRYTDGSLYGVLCGFSFTERDHFDERDVRRLEIAANSAARLLAQAQGVDVNRPLAPI